MRQWINLFEGIVPPNALDDEHRDVSVRVIEGLRGELAAAGQAVYDAWEQGEDGQDEEYGPGGICHDIADRMAEILSDHGVYCSTVSATTEVHVYVVAKCVEGVFEVDIPYRLYERGAGYVWKKIPNVKFEPDFVTISRLDADPTRFQEYVEDE